MSVSPSDVNDRRPQRVIAVVGPTASGKTALAVELAKMISSEILSCDSRQVYAGMDIGTGKDMHLYGDVKSHLISHVSPQEVYGLFRFQGEAFDVLQNWRNRLGAWHPLILCGGTGMYVESILRKFAIADAPRDDRFRDELEALPIDELAERLRRLSPTWSARTDFTSKKRIIRSLEIVQFELEHPNSLPTSYSPTWDFDPLILRVKGERQALRSRIDLRLEARLQSGMIEEVEGLIAAGLSLERLQQLGMEYREIGEYVFGLRNRDEMVARLRHAIHDLGKRQDTWFRNMDKRGLLTHAIDVDRAILENGPSMVEQAWEVIQEKWPDITYRFDAKAPVDEVFSLALILDENQRLLMLRRSVNDAFAPGVWGFPGGHLEKGETSFEAMERERVEELGADFHPILMKSLPPVRDSQYQGRFRASLFVYQAQSQQAHTIRLSAEHEEWKWVSATEYPNLPRVLGLDEDIAYTQVWPLETLMQALAWNQVPSQLRPNNEDKTRT